MTLSLRATSTRSRKVFAFLSGVEFSPNTVLLASESSQGMCSDEVTPYCSTKDDSPAPSPPERSVLRPLANWVKPPIASTSVKLLQLTISDRVLGEKAKGPNVWSCSGSKRLRGGGQCEIVVEKEVLLDGAAEPIVEPAGEKTGLEVEMEEHLLCTGLAGCNVP